MVECFGGRTRTSNSYLQFVLKPPKKNAIFEEVLVRIDGTNAQVLIFASFYVGKRFFSVEDIYVSQGTLINRQGSKDQEDQEV